MLVGALVPFHDTGGDPDTVRDYEQALEVTPHSSPSPAHPSAGDGPMLCKDLFGLSGSSARTSLLSEVGAIFRVKS